jgi:DMSO/TMAO reductase YedYZ heme-binding membrane subunit
MSGALAAGGAPSAYWYLTRSTGAVALVLLTVAVALGIADVRRISSTHWPRFVVDALHSNASLLAVVFVVLHILTSVLDGFAPISLSAALIPFISEYRPFWLGLGTVAFDILIALVLTSMMRGRISQRTWRAVHWLAFACWPIALLHGFGTGSDARSSWYFLLSILCALVVAAAVLARTLPGWRTNPRVRTGALAGVGAFTIFLAVWLPSGPLASDWARRAGTPASLLGHSAHPAHAARAQAVTPEVAAGEASRRAAAGAESAPADETGLPADRADGEQ